MQNCRDLRVVLDCPILQKPSHLQRITIKDCDRLEFITLSSGSLIQTPAEVNIENVRDVVSFPRKIFKSPSTFTEAKCLGSANLKKIRVTNTRINLINTRAINNVTGIKSIEFENVTIVDVQNLGVEAIMGNDNTAFKMINTKFENLRFKGIVVHSTVTTFSDCTFNNLVSNALNVTADYFYLTGNSFTEISANGLILKAVNTDISRNDFSLLKTNAFSNIKCLKKTTNNKQFNFSRNRIEIIDPNSLLFDYSSCKAAGTTIQFDENQMECKCSHMAFLNSPTTNTELSALILDTSNNNTCLSAPCVLPVDVIKLLLESDMCQVNLDTEVMCLLYNDKQASKNEVTTDEDVTEPAPTFYLIRQANSPNGDASAAMTAVNKDDLLKDSNLNMSNRTAIKVVFDSSRDFVETLRSTNSSGRKALEDPKPPPNEEYVNRCVGPQCRNNVAYDRQKALDFYKYVYAQLRSPRLNDKKKT